MKKNTKLKKERARKPSVAKSVGWSNLTLHKLNWLEWVTIALAAWFFFYPKPYALLLGLLLIIPILGLLLNGYKKPSLSSLINLSVDRTGKEKYDVADFIDVAAWVILLRVLVDYEFESFYSMIIPGTIACVVILAILFLTHSRIAASTRNKGWLYASLIFNVSLYSYAGTYAANCTFDYSEPAVYKTAVLYKHEMPGRRRGSTYYVGVAPWGHHYDRERIRVSQSQFNEVIVGDSVNIDLKKGLFNIPWYFIERKKNWE